MLTMVGIANRTKLVYGYYDLLRHLSFLAEDATDREMLDTMKEMEMMKLIR